MPRPNLSRLRRHARGASRIEAAVAIVFFAIVLGVLADRLAYYQRAAEQAYMDMMVHQFRSALRLEIAERLVRNREGEIAGLAGADPRSWLASRPAEPAAALVVPRLGIVPGDWQYDATRRQLRYRPSHDTEGGDLVVTVAPVRHGARITSVEIRSQREP